MATSLASQPLLCAVEVVSPFPRSADRFQYAAQRSALRGKGLACETTVEVGLDAGFQV